MEGTNLPFTKIKPEDVLYRIVSRRDVEKVATQHPIYEKYLASHLGKNTTRNSRHVNYGTRSTMEKGSWRAGQTAIMHKI